MFEFAVPSVPVMLAVLVGDVTVIFINESGSAVDNLKFVVGADVRADVAELAGGVKGEEAETVDIALDSAKDVIAVVTEVDVGVDAGDEEDAVTTWSSVFVSLPVLFESAFPLFSVDSSIWLSLVSWDTEGKVICMLLLLLDLVPMVDGQAELFAETFATDFLPTDSFLVVDLAVEDLAVEDLAVAFPLIADAVLCPISLFFVVHPLVLPLVGASVE
jgi:hypothetical protein